MRRTTLSPTLRRSSVKNLSVPTTVLSIANSRPEHRANPCRLEYFRLRLQIFFIKTPSPGESLQRGEGVCGAGAAGGGDDAAGVGVEEGVGGGEPVQGRGQVRGVARAQGVVSSEVGAHCDTTCRYTGHNNCTVSPSLMSSLGGLIAADGETEISRQL